MSKRNAWIAVISVLLALCGPWVYLLIRATGSGWVKFGYAAIFIAGQVCLLSLARWLLNRKEEDQ